VATDIEKKRTVKRKEKKRTHLYLVCDSDSERTMATDSEKKRKITRMYLVCDSDSGRTVATDSEKKRTMKRKEKKNNTHVHYAQGSH